MPLNLEVSGEADPCKGKDGREIILRDRGDFALVAVSFQGGHLI
jgi:hypothetical protein